MNLQRLSVVVAAFIATSINLLSAVKPATAVALVGLDNTNTLLLFDSANPSDVTNVPVTGVTGQLFGIDLRPTNNLIYGLTRTNNIYTIDPFSGAAKFISTLSVPFNIAQSYAGIDFDPVADLLRVVGGSERQNFSVNVDTGAVIVDEPLSDPVVISAAYANSDTDPATSTTLYTIDLIAARIVGNRLYIQNPPNAGTQELVGGLGLRALASPVGDLDIVTVDGVNTAFVGIFQANDHSLFTINLNTGAATRGGVIGDGRRYIRGLTAAPKAIPEPTTMVGLAIVGAVVASRRKPKKNSI